MEQGEVGREGIGDVTQPLPAGELAHRLQMGRTLRVEDLLGGAPGQEREHDLRELLASEVSVGVHGVEEPLLELRDSVGGDRVPLAVGAFVALDGVDYDEPVAEQPGERRVDLAEPELFLAAEEAIMEAFQLVSVSWSFLEESQKRVTRRHW